MSIFYGETLVALAGALGGGLLVKLVDRWYQLQEKTADINEAHRQDERSDVLLLKEEIRFYKQSSETWQSKYYSLFEENAILKAKYKVLLLETNSTEDSLGGKSSLSSSND